jgi:hypothetical protein
MADPTHLQTAPRSIATRDWLPWLFFICGLLTMPAIFLLGHFFSDPASHTQPSYEVPLEIVGLCCSFLSAFFTRLPMRLRFVVGVVGLFAFAAIYALCVLITMAIFGSGLPR